MEETLVGIDVAKLAKEKGFDIKSLYFYTKPNSKMFGVDEKGRSYHIKNTSKKLYKCGEHIALNIKSVYSAPTQSLLQKWLREVHSIHITITSISQESWQCHITKIGDSLGKNYREDFYNYEEALEIGLLESLKLIKL